MEIQKGNEYTLQKHTGEKEEREKGIQIEESFLLDCYSGDL